ncbi:histidine--tRNA ligase [Acidithiobacillus sp. AMEEHan]|uniref:histidine--tRNA ligase n=1 Tax=Acidithiobacillus sp. AMEEHan TaxID=2994951 RepID=UPI0027E48010|nr:histidine--tRNA ligase [Acidithiobacillus sp. AMEEHan]
MAKTTLTAVRGMNDILPPESGAWQRLEQSFRDVLARYGCAEIRSPIIEQSALFARAIGDVTDIVQKEMYTFADRNGDSLTLRPEGTAGVVRALIEHGVLRGQTPRLYYLGPMFRHERPQRGRYRQFHQLGVEFFGIAGASADAEIIALSARLLASAEISAQLQLNSLGTPESHANYREILLAYLRPHAQQLCSDCQERLERNPLRVLDCKIESCQEIASGAPQLLQHLDPESAAHFALLEELLQGMGIAYTINPRLVRGLDYYHRTVFEWVADGLGSQGTVLAGGRYDGLVAQLGGPETPAIGFALGMERILALRALRQASEPVTGPTLFLGALDEAVLPAVFRRAEELRSQGLSIVVAGPGSVKSLLKQAQRSAARYQVLLGASDLTGGDVLLKEQEGQAEWRGPWAELSRALASLGVDFP